MRAVAGKSHFMFAEAKKCKLVIFFVSYMTRFFLFHEKGGVQSSIHSKHTSIPYSCHHNVLLIINRSGKLTYTRSEFYKESSLNKRFCLSKKEQKVYKPRVIMAHVRFTTMPCSIYIPRFFCQLEYNLLG